MADDLTPEQVRIIRQEAEEFEDYVAEWRAKAMNA